MDGGGSWCTQMELKVLQGMWKSYIFAFVLLPKDDQGLGSSLDSDARDYFRHMAKHMIPFAITQPGDRDLIDLAFSKKKADDRKEWLRKFKVWIFVFSQRVDRWIC